MLAKNGFQSSASLPVPATLQIGDIIRSLLPTNYEGTGMELYNRNMLVVGLECEPKAPILRGIYVVRFSYQTHRIQPEWEMDLPFIEQNHWKIAGLTKNAVLRTNRVDLLPFDAEQFPRGLTVIGHAHSPAFFAQVAKHLRRGLTSCEAERSRVLNSAFYSSELRQTLDPDATPVAPRFDLATLIGRAGKVALTESNDYELALHQLEKDRFHARLAAGAQLQEQDNSKTEIVSAAPFALPPQKKKFPKGRKGRLERARAVTARNKERQGMAPT